jgi:SAM-dependent methyltransferase
MGEDVIRFWQEKTSTSHTRVDHMNTGDPLADGDEIFRVIQKMVQNKTLVEFGCGYGRLQPLFFDSYVGVDICRAAVEKGIADGRNVRLIEPDDPIPIADVCLCYTVLLHVEVDDLKSVINRIKDAAGEVVVVERTGMEVISDMMPPGPARPVGFYDSLFQPLKRQETIKKRHHGYRSNMHYTIMRYA